VTGAHLGVGCPDVIGNETLPIRWDGAFGETADRQTADAVERGALRRDAHAHRIEVRREF